MDAVRQLPPPTTPPTSSTFPDGHRLHQVLRLCRRHAQDANPIITWVETRVIWKTAGVWQAHELHLGCRPEGGHRRPRTAKWCRSPGLTPPAQPVTTNYLVPSASQCAGVPPSQQRLSAHRAQGPEPQPRLHLPRRQHAEPAQLLDVQGPPHRRPGPHHGAQAGGRGTTRHRHARRPCPRLPRGATAPTATAPPARRSHTGLFLSTLETNPINYGICKKPVAAGQGGGGLPYDIVPGDPNDSIIHYRMDSDEPLVAMPQIGRSVVDTAGLAADPRLDYVASRKLPVRPAPGLRVRRGGFSLRADAALPSYSRRASHDVTAPTTRTFASPATSFPGATRPTWRWILPRSPSAARRRVTLCRRSGHVRELHPARPGAGLDARRAPHRQHGPRGARQRAARERDGASVLRRRAAPAGEATLHVDWTGRFSDGLRGLYLAGEVAATQFEAADARRVFPCFDEPSFKARWALSVEVPVGLAVLSNGAVADSSPSGGGRQRIRFAETEVLPSYLVALVAGPLSSSPEDMAGDIPVRTWALPEKAHLTQFRPAGRPGRVAAAAGLLRAPLRLREARPGGHPGLRGGGDGERGPHYLPRAGPTPATR